MNSLLIPLGVKLSIPLGIKLYTPRGKLSIPLGVKLSIPLRVKFALGYFSSTSSLSRPARPTCRRKIRASEHESNAPTTSVQLVDQIGKNLCQQYRYSCLEPKLVNELTWTDSSFMYYIVFFFLKIRYFLTIKPHLLRSRYLLWSSLDCTHTEHSVLYKYYFVRGLTLPVKKSQSLECA